MPGENGQRNFAKLDELLPARAANAPPSPMLTTIDIQYFIPDPRRESVYLIAFSINLSAPKSGKAEKPAKIFFGFAVRVF